MTRHPGRGWPIASLLLAGAVLEGVYLALWVFGYPISQAAEWSVAFLTQHQSIWEAYRPFLQAAQERWPEMMVQTEPLAAIFVVLMMVAYGAYGLALWSSQRAEGVVFLAIIMVWAVAHQVTLILIPGLFTTDLFSYATYGRLPAIYGLNPFIAYPALIQFDTIASWIHPVWHYAPSVYGPLWIDFSVFLARSSAEMSPADQVFMYRLVANVAHVLNGGLVLAVLRPHGIRAMTLGFLLYAWNPLIVFEFAANGHNDAVMITFLLAAFLATRAIHPSMGLALVTLATLLKPAAVLVLPLFGWLWLRNQPGWRARAGVVLGSAAIVLGLTVVLYAPWYEGPETFGPIILWSTISPMYINYVPDVFSQRFALEQYLAGAPWEEALAGQRDRMKSITRLLFIGYYLVELWRLRRLDDLPAASARVFLAFLVLVNTWVLAWYFTWSMAMVALLPAARKTTWAAVGMTLSALTVAYTYHFITDRMPQEVYALYLAPILVPLLMAMVQWARSGNLLRRAAPTPVPEARGAPFR